MEKLEAREETSKSEELKIFWLEDVPDEIEDAVNELEKKGIIVKVAQGFVELDDHLRCCEATGRTGHVVAIVLDVMIEGVTSLRGLYPKIPHADTRNGYAAGLVFLERVLSGACEYPSFKRVPVILHSKRALDSRDEMDRIKNIERIDNRDVHVCAKMGADEIVDLVLKLSRQRTKGL